MNTLLSKAFVFCLAFGALALFLPGITHADWQVRFDDEAVRVLHLTSNPLGNFATSSECQEYWASRSQFEKTHSQCVGSDQSSSSESGQSASNNNETCASAQRSSGSSCCQDTKGATKGYCPAGYPIYKDVQSGACPDGRCFKYAEDCMKAGWGFCYTCSQCPAASQPSGDNSRGRRRR